MHGSSLKRAERLARASGLLWVIIALATVSALLVPLLVINLGLILQHLVWPEAPETASSRILGPYVGSLLSGPAQGSGQVFLLTLAALAWLLGLLQAASMYVLNGLVHRYAMLVAVALRRIIHDQAFVLGPHELLGVVRSRPEELFSDRVEIVRRGLVSWWQAVPRSVLELTLLLLLALSLNFWISLLVILLALYILPVARGWWQRAREREAAWGNQADELAGELAGALRLAPLAIGYSLEWPPGDRFDQTLQRHSDAQLRAYRSGALLKPALMLVAVASVSFVLVIVGIAPATSIAATVLWGTALLAACFPAAGLLHLRWKAQEADAAAAEILSYLDRQPSVIQLADARPLDRITRDIKLDAVTIADRDGRRLLDQVSLTIAARQHVAIVASDAQTPLALAGLFVRFYDPAAGRILYDDRDISQATLETVRGQAVLVSADGPLFSGTVAENIACGRDGFTALQISDAVRLAGAEDVVRSLPDGLSTSISRGDPRLSLEQAFRIGLARALLREPSLLVMQEPRESHGDSESQPLAALLRDASQGRTLIVLAARLITLRGADCIYLFHEGRLHAQGRHNELLQTSELYRHVNYLRFNAFRGKVQD